MGSGSKSNRRFHKLVLFFPLATVQLQVMASLLGFGQGVGASVCEWERRLHFEVQLWVDEPIWLYNLGQMFHLASSAVNANLEEIQCGVGR